MLFQDSFKTINAPSKAEYKDRGSKFLAFVFRVKTEQQCKEILNQLKKEHPQAAHHCFAYILGTGGDIQKFSDDREPSNTAGRPILRSIISSGLTQVMVIVVRYFGGKLLGVQGLIEAYGTSAMMAIKDAEIIEVELTERYLMSAPYTFENEIFKLIKQFQLKVIQHHHGEHVSVLIEVRKGSSDAMKKVVSNYHQIQIVYSD